MKKLSIIAGSLLCARMALAGPCLIYLTPPTALTQICQDTSGNIVFTDVSTGPVKLSSLAPSSGISSVVGGTGLNGGGTTGNVVINAVSSTAYTSVSNNFNQYQTIQTTWTPNGQSNFSPITTVQGTPQEQSGGLDAFTKFNYTMIDPMDGVSTTWTKGSKGTLTLDATDNIISSQCYQLATGGDGLQTVMQRENISPTLNLANQQFVLFMQIIGISTETSGPFVYFSSDNFTDFYTCDVGHTAGAQIYKYFQNGEWTPYTFTLSNCSVTGNTPDMTKVNAIQIAAYDGGVAGATVTVRVNGLGSFPLPQQGIVTVDEDNFDATWLSSGAPIAARYGIPIMTNLTPENIGIGSAWPTLAQSTMTANWSQRSFGLHPGGVFLDTVSSSATVSIINNDMNYMRSNGLGPNRGACIYPHGGFNPTIESQFRQSCSYARTIVDGDQNGLEFETFPPADPYRLRCYSVVSGDSLAKLETMVTTAEADDAWACFVFHTISTNSGLGISNVTPSLFSSFMQFLSTTPVTLSTIPQVLQFPYQTGNFRSLASSSGTYNAATVSVSAMNFSNETNVNSTAYQVQPTDSVLLINNITGGSTVTLTAAALKQELYIVKTDSTTNPATINAAGTDTIEGSTGTWRLFAKGAKIHIIGDGVSNHNCISCDSTPQFVGYPDMPTGANLINASSTTQVRSVYIPVPFQMTGIRYNASLSFTTNYCQTSLWDSKGYKLAVSPKTLCAAAGLNTINFTAPYNGVPGFYEMGVGTADNGTAFLKSSGNAASGCTWIANNMDATSVSSITIVGTGASTTTNCFGMIGLLNGGMTQ